MSHVDGSSPEPLVEQLSRREREILALLAQGYTGPEMAGKLTIAHHAGYWLHGEDGRLTKQLRHICWDGCMFPNAVMMKPETWNDILSAMIAVRDAHGWREEAEVEEEKTTAPDVSRKPGKKVTPTTKKAKKPAPKKPIRVTTKKPVRAATKRPVRKAAKRLAAKTRKPPKKTRVKKARKK